MKLYFLLLRDIVKRLRWRFPLLIGWTALVGFGEGISVVLLLPLLNLIGIANANGQGTVIKLLDKGLAMAGATTPWRILAVIAAITAVQTGLAIGLIWWTALLARRYQSQCQLEMSRAFMRAKWRV